MKRRPSGLLVPDGYLDRRQRQERRYARAKKVKTLPCRICERPVAVVATAGKATGAWCSSCWSIVAKARRQGFDEATVLSWRKKVA